MYQLYNLVLLLSGLILVPYYWIYGLRHGRSHRSIRERLGFYTRNQLACFEKQTIWIHAASVGETRAVLPLLNGIRQKYPACQILMTNMTESGHAIAQEHPDIDICLFPPFDVSWSVRKAFLQIKPEVILIAETELWPNFCRQARHFNIPLLLVNGRISDRSYSRYRLVKFLLKSLLDSFAVFCMQSQADKGRIVSLGAASDRVFNTGNLKYDNEIQTATTEQIRSLKQRYRLPEQALLLVAGSTHAGEEKILIQSYLNICSKLDKDLCLILVPRHPERRREVRGTVRDGGLVCRYRSALTETTALQAINEVLVVDTIGEVLDLYTIADLIFIGGSMVPVGGHNLLEAALVGKPVLFGPYVQNFKEISEKLIKSGAGIKVNDSVDLENTSVSLLHDAVRRGAMGTAGQALIMENTGAVTRTLEQIARTVTLK